MIKQKPRGLPRGFFVLQIVRASSARLERREADSQVNRDAAGRVFG
jgi:hypothetical protein